LQKSPEEVRKARTRNLACNDLYFLLRYVLMRADVEHQWLFDRCREVQANPNGHLDLWSREHYKSTIITYALTLQEILKNPNVTIGIFSHTRPIAKAFLRQIKRDLEGNEVLRALFDDVIWANPQRDAPKWSEDDGLIVRRTQNPKEATVEAWGLVDGMPTGKHFNILVYDDVVTEKSITNPDMIRKTTDAWALSLNLGAHGGEMRVIGTRYHFNDTYKTMMDRGAVIPRIHPATDDGTMEGEPVFLTREQLVKKRRDQGPYIFGCQMLQDPVADKTQGFDREWVNRWPGADVYGMNLYMIVDPASKKKQHNDFTTIQIIGLGEDQNYYWVAGVRDRLNLTERGAAVMKMHRQWRPLAVGYEEYGLQADIEFVKYLQDQQNYRFDITPLGGRISKEERIRRLVPIFEGGRWYMPAKHQYTTKEGEVVDIVQSFIDEELTAFPVAAHDDLIDGAARILEQDLGAEFPSPRTARMGVSATPRPVSNYDALRA
jgi:predicted phage terminase large subunit-like protein